jgi:threonine dehydratase
VLPNRIKEFAYRMSNTSHAHLLVGLEIKTYEEADRLFQLISEAGFSPLHLTSDDLAKDHLRHLIGGKNSITDGERIFSVEFPERPGVLMRFLQGMQPHWNISLCHYRDQGGDTGHCLLGLMYPPEEKELVDLFFVHSGYRYREETNHPAYRLLLK